MTIHRYRCQELNEYGSRSYCLEHTSDFTLLEPAQTFEGNAIARDVTEQLLRREPDLIALYVCGNGMPGVAESLRASGRGPSIITVANDLIEHNKMGLIDNLLTKVLAHPIQGPAAEAIAHVFRKTTDGASPTKKLLSSDIFGPENTRSGGCCGSLKLRTLSNDKGARRRLFDGRPRGAVNPRSIQGNSRLRCKRTPFLR